MLIPSNNRALDRLFYRALGSYKPFYESVVKGQDKTGIYRNTIIVLHDPTQQLVADQILARNIYGRVSYEQIRNITSKVFYPRQPTEKLSGRGYQLLRERAWTMDIADEIDFLTGEPVHVNGDLPREIAVYFFKPKNVLTVSKKDVEFRQRTNLAHKLDTEHFLRSTKPAPIQLEQLIQVQR